MVKLRFQTIIQYEYDTETGRNRLTKQFTKPVGSTYQNNQKGKDKLNFKGTKTESEEVLL